MLDMVSGREGLTGSQKRPGQEQQLAHDGGDDHLGPLASGTQALGEHAQGWVAAHGYDRWQIQGLAQRGGAEWARVAAATDARAPTPPPWAQARVSSGLTRRLVAVRGQAGQGGTGGGPSQAGRWERPP